MAEQDLEKMSVMDIFAQSQETIDDAKRKSDGEQFGKRIPRYQMKKDGKYVVRILPLAPVMDADGNALPMERKGYEYPSKELLFKFKFKDDKGKTKESYVSICHTKYPFPELKCDLVDEFVSVVLDKYSDDKALCKKVTEGSFSGGLKWSNSRYMYILDEEKRGDGIQLLGLSYSQYRDLEERKMDLWNKLCKKGTVPCPISSFQDAYFVEIKRKTESKTEYSINIDTVEDKDSLSPDELTALLNAPRIPEVIYRYTRYHLEATIAYLTNYCQEANIDVMNEPRIIDAIDKIKMSLPADDNSHFKLGENAAADGESSSNQSATIDDLWDIWEKLDEADINDRSEEGQELRTQIKEFIEENDLDIRVSRTKANLDLLHEIDEELKGKESKGDTSAKEEVKDNTPTPEPEPEDDPQPESDEAPEEEGKEEEETETPRNRRNDDTNEPAARPRRAGRPDRRR